MVMRVVKNVLSGLTVEGEEGKNAVFESIDIEGTKAEEKSYTFSGLLRPKLDPGFSPFRREVDFGKTDDALRGP